MFTHEKKFCQKICVLVSIKCSSVCQRDILSYFGVLVMPAVCYKEKDVIIFFALF